MLRGMRPIGTPAELERRRTLAVERYLDGYSISEIGCFLGVDASSVRRRVACFRQRGIPGIIARPVPGRPRKLTRTQEKIVLRWLIGNPMDHGFATELWTADRLAELMQREWQIELNHQYLARWLRTRGLSPQKPKCHQPLPDEAVIHA